MAERSILDRPFEPDLGNASVGKQDDTASRRCFFDGATWGREAASMDLTLHFLVPADRALLPRVEAAVAGGVTVVQLREKERDDRTSLAVGRELRALTRRLGVAFVVNDRPDLALVLEADGVHVGQKDLPPQAVRQVVPRSFVVGLSTTSLAEALAADADPAVDYIGFGPIYPTTSKADANPVTGLEALAEVVQAVRKPVVAIGGISPANKAEVFAAGARGVAVIAALLEATDPRRTAALLRP
jgi:thiamine-phosphate pyrophosphorylase